MGERAGAGDLIPWVDEFLVCLNKDGKKPGHAPKARFAGEGIAQH